MRFQAVSRGAPPSRWEGCRRGSAGTPAPRRTGCVDPPWRGGRANAARQFASPPAGAERRSTGREPEQKGRPGEALRRYPHPTVWRAGGGSKHRRGRRARSREEREPEDYGTPGTCREPRESRWRRRTAASPRRAAPSGGPAGPRRGPPRRGAERRSRPRGAPEADPIRPAARPGPSRRRSPACRKPATSRARPPAPRGPQGDGRHGQDEGGQGGTAGEEKAPELLGPGCPGSPEDGERHGQADQHARYLVAAARPVIAPARAASRRGWLPPRAPSAKHSAARTKKATSGLMLTMALRATSAGTRAASHAARSPAACPARRQASRPVRATTPREKSSVTRRPMISTSTGSTMS